MDSVPSTTRGKGKTYLHGLLLPIMRKEGGSHGITILFFLGRFSLLLHCLLDCWLPAADPLAKLWITELRSRSDRELAQNFSGDSFSVSLWPFLYSYMLIFIFIFISISRTYFFLPSILIKGAHRKIDSKSQTIWSKLLHKMQQAHITGLKNNRSKVEYKNILSG